MKTVDEKEQESRYDKKHPFHARVKENIRVTSSEHFQDTRLVKFDIMPGEQELKYQPGDVVMILPSNLKENVEQFLGLFYACERFLKYTLNTFTFLCK